jgi:WD40 repeat protein
MRRRAGRCRRKLPFVPVMKRLFAIFGVLVLAGGLVFTGFKVEARNMARRLQRKAETALAGVRSWAEEGREPSTVLAVMQQVKPALDAGDPHQAEALLDQALKMLSDRKPGDKSPLPVYAGKEQQSDLFGRPEPVSIEGYAGSAMEPFLSPDGRYLFFNNENEPNVDTNLHFAERIGKLSFRHLGELPGANSAVLDAAPSLDRSGHFYFTTVREYDRTMNSVYTGEFDGKTVRKVHPVPGNISPRTPGTINMDVSISPDGQTLYISRAIIFPGATSPKSSQLMVARLKGGAFSIDPASAAIMKNVNTPALQYAPSISADGRELYFTRASQLAAGPEAPGASLRIMVATRTSVYEPFGEPRALTALSGFVEAPTISLEGKEMFFHKKVGHKFAIYRAQRKARYTSAARQ